MKVKCKSCGLIRELNIKDDICPECGCRHWWSLPKKKTEEKIDRESLDIMKDLATIHNVAKKWLEEKGYMYSEKMGVPDDSLEEKEEGLAFEIFDIKDGKKTNVRKIYFNGHVEGFKGDPCIINHIVPKILAIKAILKQMNKDYRDFIEKHFLLADLPIDPIEFIGLYQAQLERIMNIKICP